MAICCAALGSTGVNVCKTACTPCGCSSDKVALHGAGVTGIEPATCGFGACCRSFSNVQGRTQRGLKWLILTVQSVWKFRSVHRRWGLKQLDTIISSEHPQGCRSAPLTYGLLLAGICAPNGEPSSRIILHQSGGRSTLFVNVCRHSCACRDE